MTNKTYGAAIPVLPNPEISEFTASAQLLGTVNNNRGRWNPFLPENDMTKDGAQYSKEVELRANGGRHRDGIYAFRFTTNHSLFESFKANHYKTNKKGKPKLVTGESTAPLRERANKAQNIIIKIEKDGVYTISFNPTEFRFNISPQPTYLTEIESVQLNGFIWDEEDMFQKFDETRPNHEMTKNGDWWEKTLPLKTDGGIDFRADGVYQFLFSANHNEDWGFAAYNDGKGTLVGGTGFGSSGGQSKHSGITIQVFANADYTIRMNPKKYKFEVKSPEGVEPVTILNDITSFQLLGTFNADEYQFEPTNPKRNMANSGDNIWQKTVQLSPGIYGANFAISHELFLDTMALGAWLESDKSNKLMGLGWHGKPNEPNVFFQIETSGDYQFTYDGNKDEFAIECVSDNKVVLKPLTTIDTLQLVGNFDAPLQAWDPTNPDNNMERVGNSIFTKDVELQANNTYEYKYTANNWNWLWVFADYELDGYGTDFAGRNPDVVNSRIEDLKLYGQLTTHGDPPTLKFTPEVRGWYTFTVNLETGAYSVQSK
ncbi:MAG: hypothetical protein GDA44_03365 [Prochloron sp. SP5CPC1]|nr:hypothetical protein [Candidatus Paraprochloron terpiosi SP5CPC1]